ncbi:hypothetical protein PGT21_016961 [Puccinia graminis f. sp. tritici]|uniref:Uncharacterized protein n=1 Tax=Puccinia graminis f. sp. tritici TaxID=56615 RepID=A0A5B0MN78_PUCGR|nr:hypothetical protein PGT21_016961 [Puccinia graminis f. sp. tritici]
MTKNLSNLHLKHRWNRGAIKVVTLESDWNRARSLARFPVELDYLSYVISCRTPISCCTCVALDPNRPSNTTSGRPQAPTDL